jgi:hypothetical protein
MSSAIEGEDLATLRHLGREGAVVWGDLVEVGDVVKCDSCGTILTFCRG